MIDLSPTNPIAQPGAGLCCVCTRTNYVSVGSTSEDIFAGMDFVLRGGGTRPSALFHKEVCSQCIAEKTCSSYCLSEWEEGFKVSVPEMVPPWRSHHQAS